MDEPNVFIMTYEYLTERLIINHLSEESVAKSAERWSQNISFFVRIEEV